nr:calcium-transporting atpase 9, plasma membrane-type [Quercus suber]
MNLLLDFQLVQCSWNYLRTSDTHHGIPWKIYINSETQLEAMAYISIVIAIISWPLAVLGKLIPVPATPVSNYFTRLIQRWRAARNARNAM